MRRLSIRSSLGYSHTYKNKLLPMCRVILIWLQQMAQHPKVYYSGDRAKVGNSRHGSRNKKIIKMEQQHKQRVIHLGELFKWFNHKPNKCGGVIHGTVPSAIQIFAMTHPTYFLLRGYFMQAQTNCSMFKNYTPMLILRGSQHNTRRQSCTQSQNHRKRPYNNGSPHTLQNKRESIHCHRPMSEIHISKSIQHLESSATNHMA